MVWRCATKTSNKLIDIIPRYSSADHGSILKSLLTVVSEIMKTSSDEFTGPYFDLICEYDESVQSYLDNEYHQLANLNLEMSLRKDYWRLFYEAENDLFRLSLAPPQRRSALTLLDHKAEFLSMSPESQAILSGKISTNEAIPLILSTGMNEVKFLRDAVPEAWGRLAGQIGFTLDEAVQFQAFVQVLMEKGKLWFRIDDLLELFTVFTDEQGLTTISEDRIALLIDFYSATPEIVLSWGIAVPFVRFKEWFVYWPFVHHVLPPSLTFLSLAMRKYPEDWNNTVGSDLAKVANTIRDDLPNMPNLLFVTVKKKKGVGDIDLGIYDSKSRVFLLCEIKTVFNRFRTNYQLSNFTDQRVNFDKAASQLVAVKEAIESGAWTLSEIFNRKIDGSPSSILTVVLTWYDNHNPWIGVEEQDLVSCNFRIFKYLFTHACGNLDMLHEAIAQLSRIYCVASLQPSFQLPVEGKEVFVKREVQTELLPPKEELDKMQLCELVRQELSSLPKLPENWRDQLKKMGQKDYDYHIYGFDER